MNKPLGGRKARHSGRDAVSIVLLVWQNHPIYSKAILKKGISPLLSPHTRSTFGCAVERATFITFGSGHVPLFLRLEPIFLTVWWMGGGVRTAVFIEGQFAVGVWIMLYKCEKGKHRDESADRSWTNLSDKCTRRKERQASGSGHARDELLHPYVRTGLIHKDGGIRLSNYRKHNCLAQLGGRTFYVHGRCRTEWGQFLPYSICRTVTPQHLNQHNTQANQGT